MDIVERERAEADATAAPSGAHRDALLNEGALGQSSMNGAPSMAGVSGAGVPNAASANGGSDAGTAAASGPLASASPPSRRDVEIDIHTDETPDPPVVAAAPAGEDAAIEVSDDEIETAEPSIRRSLVPPPPSAGGLRSRPPAPPSSRPRPASSSLLPPPRHLANGSSRPPGIDPWLLANKTLELSHALAHIAELEEQVAFRDARIAELEDSLAKARRKLEDLEARSRLAVASVGSPPSSAALSTSDLSSSDLSSSVSSTPAVADPHRPEVTETRAVAVTASPDRAREGSRAIPMPEISSRGGATDDEDEDASVDDSDAGFGSVEALAGGARAGSDDNLQQISGIGPRFEAALRKHGITRLSQIAAWSEADVRQVAKALKIPKSRIVKGRWVEVAREVIGTRAASE